ncbi:hypothetical protein FQN49_005913 [Arthroderma sp. PD_2]|nr:hypothetical protein FQN49_005913 [Arthroderma sp. PD_2]
MAAAKLAIDLTYPSPIRGTDHRLDDIEDLCPLDNGRHQHVTTSNIGALEQLPLELLHMMLVQLDIRSLTDFRRVNGRARQLTDSIPQYQKIIKHAPETIRGILSIETGRWFTCENLYKTLCTAECDICGDFGGYLYLLTCRRACYFCFTKHPEYLPLLVSDASRKFGLAREQLSSLPSMRSLPGRYSPRDLKSSSRLTLVDHSSARDTGVTLHGTVGAMEKYASDMIIKKLDDYEDRKSLYKKGYGPKPRRPRSEDEFDEYESNPKRFMAIVQAPFLQPCAKSPEWGFHCLGCKKNHYDKPTNWRRKFIQKSFDAHIKEFGEIISKKHSKIVTQS